MKGKVNNRHQPLVSYLAMRLCYDRRNTSSHYRIRTGKQGKAFIKIWIFISILTKSIFISIFRTTWSSFSPALPIATLTESCTEISNPKTYCSITTAPSSWLTSAWLGPSPCPSGTTPTRWWPCGTEPRKSSWVARATQWQWMFGVLAASLLKW